jgi:hypothetical protein
VSTREYITEQILTELSVPKPIPQFSPTYDGDLWSDIVSEHEKKWADNRRSWFKQSDPAWVLILVDLMTHPPALDAICSRFEEACNYRECSVDNWRSEIQDIISDWVNFDAKSVVQHLETPLDSSESRCFLLQAVSFSPVIDLLPVLRRLAMKVETLDECEDAWLITALSRIRSSEVDTLLNHIASTIGESRQEAMKALGHARSYRATMMVE